MDTQRELGMFDSFRKHSFGRRTWLINLNGFPTTWWTTQCNHLHRHPLTWLVNYFFTGDENGEHPGPTYFWKRNDDIIKIFQDTFTSRRPRVAIFAGIIKIITMFINNIFLDSKNGKRIRNYTSKRSLYLCFLISGEKCCCQ